MAASPLPPCNMEGEDDRTLLEAFAFLDDWHGDVSPLDLGVSSEDAAATERRGETSDQDDASLSPPEQPASCPTASPQVKEARRTTAVRRKAEIRHLRQKAVELQMRADLLRLIRDSRQLLQCGASLTDGPPPKTTLLSKIWMDTAQRQRKLRATSEAENERLRGSVKQQRKFLVSIRNMIKRHALSSQQRQETTTKAPLYSRVSDGTAADGESIRAIEQTCLRIESELFAVTSSELSACAATMTPCQVGAHILQISATKVRVTFSDSRTMPFALLDVARVMWETMTERCLEHDQFFEQRSFERHGTWVRSYQMQHRVATQHIKLNGQTGMRKRHEENRVAYAFAGASNPFEVNGEGVAGISMSEQGYIVVSRSAVAPSADACQLEFTLQVDIDVNASALRPYAQLIAEVIATKNKEQLADMVPKVETALLLGHS